MPKAERKTLDRELQTIRLQAVGWVERFHERALSWTQLVRYLDWVHRSPLHFKEMRSILALRAALSDVRLWDRVLQKRKPDEPYH